MESARPLEDMTQEEIEQWYKDNDMNPKGFIECKSTDALNVLSFMDRCHNIAGEFSMPIEELDDYNAKLAKKTPLSPTEEEDIYMQEESEVSQEKDLSRELAREIIAQALDQLPPRQQEAMRLVIMGGLTKSAAARRMDISRQALGHLITKGLQALEKYYEMLGGTDLNNYI